MESKNRTISRKRQCELLLISRSSSYYTPVKKSRKQLRLERLADELFTQCPFYGKRSLSRELKKRGYAVGVKQARTIMRELGLMSVAPKPTTSKKHPQHKIYPYLLRNLAITRPNQVWCSDITYIRLEGGFVYLTVIMDWYSRKILAWRISPNLESRFCVEALQEALRNYPHPDIFNTDQGSQYTSDEFTGVLLVAEIEISMDGRGRWVDNVMVERFWRTLKYENIFLNEYRNLRETGRGVAKYIEWYNGERSHQSFDGKTPDEVYFSGMKQKTAA